MSWELWFTYKYLSKRKNIEIKCDKILAMINLNEVSMATSYTILSVLL